MSGATHLSGGASARPAKPRSQAEKADICRFMCFSPPLSQISAGCSLHCEDGCLAVIPNLGIRVLLCRFSDNCQRFLRSKCRVEHSSLLSELIKILSWCFYRLSSCPDKSRNARKQERLPRVWLVYHILYSYYNNSHSFYF